MVYYFTCNMQYRSRVVFIIVNLYDLAGGRNDLKIEKSREGRVRRNETDHHIPTRSFAADYYSQSIINLLCSVQLVRARSPHACRRVSSVTRSALSCGCGSQACQAPPATQSCHSIYCSGFPVFLFLVLTSSRCQSQEGRRRRKK